LEKTVIDIAREIQAIAQSGLSFSKDPFDQERFKQLQEIASTLVARHSIHEKESIDRLFSAESGYATPKLDVRAAAFRDAKILLVRERDSAGWTLPGGFVDVNESLREAVTREAKEESGFDVVPRKIAAIFDHRKHGYKPHLYHFYKIYVLCDIEGGQASLSPETSEIKFFSRSEIDELYLDPGRGTRAHICRMFEHLADRSLQTDFD
jgi:ADP-ribose pyrophosphatase YjhB (NUDIX family)